MTFGEWLVGFTGLIVFMCLIFWPVMTRKGTLRQQMDRPPPVVAGSKPGILLRLFQLAIIIGVAYWFIGVAEEGGSHVSVQGAIIIGLLAAFAATELLYRLFRSR
jgi:hypothetical protein